MQPYPQYGAPPPAMGPAYGMPNPAYGPPPGYYPPPMPAFHTRDGVKYFSQALLLQVIIGLLGFILALAAIATLLSLGSGNWGATVGSVIALGSTAILLFVLLVIFIILVLVGFVRFFQGKDEFGPAHSKNFLIAVILFILGIVIPNAAGSYEPAGSGGTDLAKVLDSIRASMIFSGVVGIIGPIFMGLGLTTLVKQFTTEEASKFRTGLILLVAGPIVGLVAMLAVFPSKPGTGVTAAQLWQFASVATLGLSIGSIVSLVGYYFFYQGYKSIHEKMQHGVIRPGAMPAPMAPPGYAPPPMPPQPYPPQPMAPQPYPQPPAAPMPYQPPPPANAPYQPQPPMAPTPSCLSCGNPLPPGALVCPRCGGRV